MIAKKFLFDDIFEQNHRAKNEPIYSQLEVDQLLSQRHGLGFNEGQTQAQNDIDAMNQRHLDHIHDMTKQILNIHLETHEALGESVSSVCRLIIQKILPFMLQKYGFEEIFSFVDAAINSHNNDSEMKISVAEDYVQSLKDKLTPIMKQHNDLILKVEADPTLQPSECRVEWQSGGIERLLNHINTQVDEALNRMTAYAAFQKQQLSATVQEQIVLTGDTSHE